MENNAMNDNFNAEVLNQESSPYTIIVYVVKKTWKFLFVISLFFGLLGYYFAYCQKPTYESKLSFVLDEGEQSGLSGALGLAAQFGINIGESKGLFNNDNIIEIIKSRRIIENVLLSVDTFDRKPYTLIEYYIDQSGLRDNQSLKNPYIKTHFNPGISKSTCSYQQDSLLYCVYNKFHNDYITAERRDKKTNVYEIRVVSSNERFTKIFTDRLQSETDVFFTYISSKKAKNTLDILEARVNSMKNNMSNTISQRAAIQDANVNPAMVSAQAPLQQKQADIQVYGAAYAELFKSLEMARFQYLKGLPLMQIIDAADYPMKKIKMSKIKTALIASFLSFIILVFFYGLIIYVRMKPLAR